MRRTHAPRPKQSLEPVRPVYGWAPILMTVEEAAHHLGMGINAAKYLVGTGELPSYTRGKLRRLLRDDVEAWARQEAAIGKRAAAIEAALVDESEAA